MYDALELQSPERSGTFCIPGFFVSIRVIFLEVLSRVERRRTTEDHTQTKQTYDIFELSDTPTQKKQQI